MPVQRRFLLSLLSSLALCGGLFPQGARAQAPLRVLLNGVAPYTLHGDPQRPGMHHEIMQALSRRSELAMEFKSAVYVRLALSLKDNSADLVGSVESPEFEALGRRVMALHAFKSVVLTRRDAGITGVPQLKGKLLGMARGAFYDDSINNDEDIRKYHMPDPFQGVRMLAVGRLDAIISSDYLLAHALRQSGVDNSIFAPPFVVNEKSYVLYARKDLGDDTVQRLRAAMEALQKSGQIVAILRAYQ